MKTINDYAIYCTEEQTKKALKLGAQINMHAFDAEFVKANKERFKNIVFVDEKCYCLPTAEEMIGWLEEQFEGILIAKNICGWVYAIIREEYVINGYNCYPTRKKATLAAIDATLDNLINKLKFSYLVFDDKYKINPQVAYKDQEETQPMIPHNLTRFDLSYD